MGPPYSGHLASPLLTQALLLKVQLMVSDICGSMELDACISKAVRLLPLVYVHPNSAGASVSPKAMSTDKQTPTSRLYRNSVFIVAHQRREKKTGTLIGII